MRLLYLGEYIQSSMIVWSLQHSNKFERIDHLVKPTLDYCHVDVVPDPDLICIKCDFDDHELRWARRYGKDIPKLFITCDFCIRKLASYMEMGKVFNLMDAINNKDMMLDTLVNAIINYKEGVGPDAQSN